MIPLNFSFIIPVYNRPDEVGELLESLSLLEGNIPFEVIIIEDGSTVSCKLECDRFRESLNIHYHYKNNSGPGDSRNVGMTLATGDYFIILDSDCVLPANYLNEVNEALALEYVDCYGGPDAADDKFTNLQKAINYSMTSFLTTGGIRGSSENLGKFQPRSFNMGLSRAAFLRSGGFGKIHPGEDPDLTIRLWKLGYDTRLFKKAYVYHKRRISFKLFYKQVNKFGKVRVILNKWHPHTAKLTYWFPSIFSLLLVIGIIASVAGSYWILSVLTCYLLIIGIHCTFKNGLRVGAMTVIATVLQFLGYGMGFMYAFWVINILGKDERMYFKQLFFK